MIFRSRHSGLSLVEILISLVLASSLLIATGELYLRSKATMNTAQQLAELRENGRYALQTIAADIRRAGFLGEARPPTGPLLISDLPHLTDCNKTTAWGQALQEPLIGLNDGLKDIQRDYRACIPTRDYLRGDVLTVRYGSPVENRPWHSATSAQTPYLFASLVQPRILLGEQVSTALAREPETSVYALNAFAYHIAPAQESHEVCDGENYPALARRGLDHRGLPRREEITEGIENLQVKIGVDTDSDGSVDRYVEPHDLQPDHIALAVRIWVLARARCAEAGYLNGQRYELGDLIYVPNDHYRREMFSLTVALRGIHGVYAP